MTIFAPLPPLSPAYFFEVEAECFPLQGPLKPKQKYRLPNTSPLLGEEPFLDLYAGWRPEGLSFYLVLHCPLLELSQWELFLDTRHLKRTGIVSRFCHHFLFFPFPVQGVYGKEITRFRGEDVHPLAQPEDFIVRSTLRPTHHFAIDIPAVSLHGYDPAAFPKLGFTYRARRVGGAAQHFALPADEFAIESHPATWGTLHLCETTRHLE